MVLFPGLWVTKKSLIEMAQISKLQFQEAKQTLPSPKTHNQQ